MKKCSKCMEMKSREEFKKSKTSSDGLDSWCRPCSAEKNREIYNEKITAVRAYKKGHGCQICGYNENALALTLDHLDPSQKHPSLKKGSGSFASLGWDNMWKEVRKCRVLCANCHIIESHEKGHHMLGYKGGRPRKV